MKDLQTSVLYFKIKNISERNAVISILAKTNKMIEKKEIVPGKKIVVEESSPGMTAQAKIFLTRNLQNNCTNMDFEFDKEKSKIVANLIFK